MHFHFYSTSEFEFDSFAFVGVFKNADLRFQLAEESEASSVCFPFSHTGNYPGSHNQGKGYYQNMTVY